MRIFWRAMALPAYGSPRPADNLLGDGDGDLLVVIELHRVGRAALADRAQVGRVAEGLGEGDDRGDDAQVAALVDVQDVAAAGAYVAQDVAEELVRAGHLHLHVGLQED